MKFRLSWKICVVIFLFLLFFTICLVSRDIIVIHSFKEIDFNAIAQNSLVIFDVDETLIQPRDATFAALSNQSQRGKEFAHMFMQKYPSIDFDYLYSLILQQADWPLIEPDIIPIIEALKERSVQVIACTNMNTGAYGALPSMEQWRFEHLKSLGFQGSWQDKILKMKINNQNPIFYKGLLAADLTPKGLVVGAFLDEIQCNPTKIIMIDDSLNYLESMQQECKKRVIPFEGYEYKGAVDKPWDEKMAELQANYLLEHKKWLSDVQVAV